MTREALLARFPSGCRPPQEWASMLNARLEEIRPGETVKGSQGLLVWKACDCEPKGRPFLFGGY